MAGPRIDKGTTEDKEGAKSNRDFEAIARTLALLGMNWEGILEYSAHLLKESL